MKIVFVKIAFGSMGPVSLDDFLLPFSMKGFVLTLVSNLRYLAFHNSIQNWINYFFNFIIVSLPIGSQPSLLYAENMHTLGVQFLLYAFRHKST